MKQPPMNPSPLESIPDDESLEDRLARTWARRARQASRAPEHQPVLDPESLDAILKRTWARRAEQARSASTQSPMHPAPLERHQGEAHRPPGQNGQSEDKESANLLSDEMSGPSVLSVSSALPTRTGHGPDQESMADLDKIQARLSADITRAAEDRMLSTQTGHGQDVEATADLTDESAAHPSPTPNGTTRFTQGLQNEKSKAAPTTLSDEIKEFIVKGLACYDTPSQVAEAVNLMFGVTVSRQRVYRYDPDNPRPPAQRWRDLHAATRQVLLREHAEIGVAHRAVRLRRLDRLASRCERNNVTTALKCLEMAAKECGGMYEKRRPIVLQVPVPPA